MRINFLIKRYVVLLSSSLLVACATSPQHQPPISAKQLANRQLANSQLQPHTTKVNKPLRERTVANLPSSQHQALRNIYQNGRVPTLTTIHDQSLDLSGDEPVEFEINQEQSSLRHVIEQIAELLALNVVIDPSIGDKVTIRFAEDNPITKKDLWPFLQLLLNNAGVTMTKRGNVYNFKKTGPSKLPGAISMNPDTLTYSNSPEVLQITPLRYITAQAALTVINPLIQPKGHVIALPTLNVIGIVTTPERLRRVNKLLSVIDADPFLHRGMRLFRLFNSKATEVQSDLDKILKAIYGKTQPTYEAIALERINGILVVAPPNSGFTDVATWVEILDERIGQVREQVFIYKVKNLEAAKLASTLSSVFKLDKKAAEEKKRREKSKPGTPAATSSNGTVPVSAELEVTIVADESTNSLLIRASPRDYRQLLETIYRLDEVPKEVMINVVLAEVKLTESTQFGIDWQAIFGGRRLTIGSNLKPPAGNFPAEPNPSGDDAPSLAGLTGLTLNYISGQLNALLNIIASNNELSILSRPSLLVRNNEEASINIGSNEPFLSGVNSSTQNNQILSNDVQYKDTGITVKVTPRINDDGIINLKIFQELSQLGETRTTQNLQSFITRKIETSVVVRDGSAIVIGGLIETTDRNSEQGIPILKDLPYIGKTLFSSTDKTVDRTEMVLIIVPEIVNPEADNRPLVINFKNRLNLVSKLLNDRGILVEELAEDSAPWEWKPTIPGNPDVQIVPPTYSY